MFLVRIFVLLATLSFAIPIYTHAQPGGSAGQAQTGKLSGRLVDGEEAPVPYTTVVLLRSDSTIVSGSLTDENGAFVIEPTGIGSFTLRISGIGIDQQEIHNISITTNNPNKVLGNITVQATAQALGAVTIVKERPVMQMNIDKKVFNVEKNTTATGGSAVDVLQNVPSVSVDVEGNVSLRGKAGVNILIDGKPATLLGSDVAAALQSMPASSIENIEVITNPSSKYDAQGMTGIINIVTKKDRRMGFNGNVSVGAGTRDKYNASLGLNLKNEKWNLFLNSSFRRNRNYHRFGTERLNYYNDTTHFSYEDHTRNFMGNFNTIGAEYIIDNKNSVTLTQNINIMSFGGGSKTDFWSYDNGVEYAYRKRYSKRTGGPLSSSTSLNYKHKFAKPGQELTADITYVNSNSEHTQTYTTNNYTGDYEQIGGTLVQSQPSEGGRESFNGQIDYTMPFLSKTGRFDAGVKTQIYTFDSRNNPTLDSGRGPESDLLLLNDYKYTQEIDAAYINFKDEAGKWGYQAGLRLEYAKYEGTARMAQGETFGNDYLGLFPSAYLSYKLPKDQTVYLSYTRRTDRPSFWRLMPYYDLSNPQDTGMGNPNLLPEFIHNAELNYNRQFTAGHNIMVSTYYQYTKNLIERIRTLYDDGTSFTQPQNIASAVTYGFELIGRLELTRAWDATGSFNYFHNVFQGQAIDPMLNRSGPGWFAKLNTNYRLPKNFSLQLNGNYRAEEIEAQGRDLAFWSLDVALRKSFWDNKASLVLNVSDIFNTRKQTRLYEYPNYLQTTNRDRETRVGNITFSYRFGQSDKSAGRKGRQGNNGVQTKDRSNSGGDDGDQGGF